ncbi:MAG: hypothetical protein J2P25_20860, partial [Nocardiopsaceae bacterium]|nr:hypothetical protein [Nocardiopsaceae bacterium]
MTGRARTGRARTGREFRRAKWRLTAVIAGAITGAILLVGVLMCLAVTADQHWQAQHDLEWAVARNSAESPPPCVWMATVRDGVTHRTPGAPAGLPVRSDL